MSDILIKPVGAPSPCSAPADRPAPAAATPPGKPNSQRQAAQANAERVLAALRGVAGVDVDRGLAVLRGSAEKYLDLVSRLVETERPNMAELARRVDAGNHPAARQLAHGLKGAAATLGLNAISRAAAALEKPLREDAPQPGDDEAIRAGAARLAEALGEIAAVLLPLPALERGPATRSEPLPPEALRAVLAQLEQLLGQHDVAAIGYFAEHAAALAQALGPASDDIGRQIREFAFQQALSTLRTLSP